jgi:hypothetical protein
MWAGLVVYSLAPTVLRLKRFLLCAGTGILLAVTIIYQVRGCLLPASYLHHLLARMAPFAPAHSQPPGAPAPCLPCPSFNLLSFNWIPANELPCSATMQYWEIYEREKNQGFSGM